MRIERTKNTVRNIAWGYINRIIMIVLPFIFRTVMIKCLGADYLGINSLFGSILQVLSLTELGFGSAVVYSMYKPIADGDDTQICALLAFYKKVYKIIGTVILCLGTAILPLIPHLISGSYPVDINIYVVYYVFLLNTAASYFLFGYQSSILSAFQRNDLQSKASLIVTIIKYIIEIVGIYFTRQYYLFLAIEFVATIGGNLVQYYYVRKHFPQYLPCGEIDNKQKQTIKENVFSLLCHKIGGVILNSADNIVLSAYMGVVVVSTYGNYYYILSAVEAFILVCFTSMIAGIGNIFVTETIEKQRSSFENIFFFNAWIVGICSTCMACLYQDFINAWVGDIFLMSTEIMYLMVVYFFTHCIRRTIIAFRDGAGMWRDNRMQPIVSASFNLVINIILIQSIGIAGVIISSIISMILIDIPWETHAFCKKIGMSDWNYLGRMALYFTVTAVSIVLSTLISNTIHTAPVISMIIKALISFVITSFIFWLLFHRSKEYKYLQSSANRIIHKAINRLSKSEK